MFVNKQSDISFFFQKVDFTVHHPTTVTKIKDYHLADCTEDGIGAHGERTWVSVLELPKDVNYPNLVRCSLIKASYYLKVSSVLIYLIATRRFLKKTFLNFFNKITK